MINVMGVDLLASAYPVLIWLQGRGLKFADNAFGAIAILVVGAIAIRFLEKMLQKTLEYRKSVHESQRRFFMSVILKCAWVLLIVVTLEKLGVPVATLLAGLGVTGVVLGLPFRRRSDRWRPVSCWP